VYAFTEWSVDSNRKTVSGDGRLLDINRQVLMEGSLRVPVDSVAIFETNEISVSPAIAAMTIVTCVSLAITTVCIVNPKACFGSCPTFYVEDGHQPILQAEGFSSSVAPSLEAPDIDALYRAQPAGEDFDVVMKNEAFETHVVRSVDLLAAQKPQGGRVFEAEDGTFWQATRLTKPIRCQGPEGCCLKELQDFDGIERISLTDSTYLGTKETIELEFDNPPKGKLGLVVASRQSLLSTYLFYQGLAYAGNSVGEWMASLERGEKFLVEGIESMNRALGGIEILCQDNSGNWATAAQLGENGPLATDLRVAVLPDTVVPERIRLRFTQGHWRIDYVSLALMGQEISPLRRQPVLVRSSSTLQETAREVLLDTSKVLVTMPGDVYTLTYRLPADYAAYELFLESRGYYLEWIRDEWLAEEDPAKAAMIFLSPERALRILAPEFKEIEIEMEELFWRSRYAR
jgi:hypothetical protein